MFKDENAFREFILGLLQSAGYVLMGRDATVHSRKKIDLLMKRNDGKITAIEIKLRDRRGIVDDITKLSRLQFLPGVDLFYVAAPKINLQEDILGFAKKMGIGVLAIKDQAIEQLVKSEEVSPAFLQGSSSVPNIVIPGQVFEVRISVENRGGKMARNIEIMYMPAYPFRVPKGERNHKIIKELMPGKKETVTFKVRVKDDAETGKHHLYTRRTAEGLEAHDSLHNIEVREKLG